MILGSVFPILVKKFWVNASTHFNDEKVEKIQFFVINTPITITSPLIVDVIQYEEDGADI